MPVKSQWDFGELFPQETFRKVLTVAELTEQIRKLLERQVGRVWVSGEVSNLRAQVSGHLYFTLKDSETQLNCVLFRGESQAARTVLQDGRKVLLEGEVTVYGPRGQYQLRVIQVEVQGIGALQIAFEKLKQKLQAEGWFAPERKRPLPRFPARIGLVTSPTGAAIRDVLHVVQRRHPGLEILLAACRVQGDGAAQEIAASIRMLNEWSARETAAGRPGLDLILVTRGGGSLEDLWAFNEEVVARAIFESRLPLISAVGHEIDFSISDFVADWRAATPSAAAEIITEGAFASRAFVARAGERLSQLARKHLEAVRDGLDQVTHRLALTHPRRKIEESLQLLDGLWESLLRTIHLRVKENQVAVQALSLRLAQVKPAQMVKQKGERVEALQRRLKRGFAHAVQGRQDQFATLETRLRLLSPLNVLGRGYSITRDAATGRVIRSPQEVQAGQRLKTRVRGGEIESLVEPHGGVIP